MMKGYAYKMIDRLGLTFSKFVDQPHIMTVARFSVLAYYSIAPVLAFAFFFGQHFKRPNFEPFWPISWIQAVPLSDPNAILLIQVAFAATAALVPLYHRYRWVRVLFFIMLWQVHALESSFGAIDRGWYTWLYTSGIFIFLPDIWSGAVSRVKRQKALLTIWTAQAFVMLTYTMAGVHKVVAVGIQHFADEIHGLSPDALLYQASWWLPQLQHQVIPLEYIELFPVLAWAAYVSVHYVQLFAIWTMFRFSLQHAWTVLLVLQHYGIYLILGAVFYKHIMLAVILFFTSPFAVDQGYTLKQKLKDLPIFGPAFLLCKRFLSKRKKVFDIINT